MSSLLNSQSTLNNTRSGYIHPSKAWNVKYDADVLPNNASPAWTGFGTATTLEINPSGFLHVVSSTSADCAYAIDNTGIDFSRGFTFEVRMQVVSGQAFDFNTTNTNSYSYFQVSEATGDLEFSLHFWSDGVSLQCDDSESLVQYLFYAVDTSTYHTYRVTAIDTVVNLFVDGTLVETGVPQDGGSNDNIYWAFEELGVANMEQNWDYVYYKN